MLGFVVPNEEADATTTKVVVQFPSDTPIAEATVEAIPGWTAEVTSSKLTTPIETDDGTFNEAVKNVTWTATGAGIAVEHFQSSASRSGCPTTPIRLTFPTIQTYSDGQTVDWVQVDPARRAGARRSRAGAHPDRGRRHGTTTPTTDAPRPRPTLRRRATSTTRRRSRSSPSCSAIIGLLAAAFALVTSRRKTDAPS